MSPVNALAASATALTCAVCHACPDTDQEWTLVVKRVATHSKFVYCRAEMRLAVDSAGGVRLLLRQLLDQMREWDMEIEGYKEKVCAWPLHAHARTGTLVGLWLTPCLLRCRACACPAPDFCAGEQRAGRAKRAERRQASVGTLPLVHGCKRIRLFRSPLSPRVPAARLRVRSRMRASGSWWSTLPTC